MSKGRETKWIVRDHEGKIYGPFTTDQVLAQIDRNYFLGSEDIALYPGGLWAPISRTPEFSDRLLDVLSDEVQQSRPRRPSSEELKEEKTVEITAASESKNETRNEEKPELVTISQNQTSSQSGLTPPTLSQNRPSSVIELADLKTLERNAILNSSKLPLILIASAVLMAFIGLFMTEGENKEGNRVRLLAPRAGDHPQLSDEKIKEKFSRALKAFQSDTFSGYQKAQNELVELVEGTSAKVEKAKQRAEMISTLCLVYREIWPFAFQDSRDLKIIGAVTQEAKRLDPGGLNGALCEIVQLMVSGRIRDAQGLAESMLDEVGRAPVLFEIRGDAYMESKDAVNAANYFQQARTLWPAWQKISIQEARARTDLKQFSPAIQLYRDVLKKVPEHPIAKIELGSLEALQFNQLDKGIELLRSGLGSSERIPPAIQANGYLAMARVYFSRNEKTKALEFARKAHEANSGNGAAKDLLVLLAGETGLEKTKPKGNELVFVGDQYMRSGDCFAAQAEYKAAFEAQPKNGVAAMKAGKCLWQLNQSQDAIDWMRKAIRADPQLTAAYVELADFYAQRFDFGAATETLKQIQRLQPKSYEVYRGFAAVELRRNNFAGAVGFASRAMKLYENDLETFLIMAKANIGLQKYQDAERFAAKAIELDFSNTEAHALYGKTQAALHGVEAGAAYIQKMINRYVITQGAQIPQAAIDFRITLGEIYIQDERYKLAEDAFRQAISLDRNSKKALIWLGKVLQSQNQGSQALEFFLRAAVLDPSDADPVYWSGLLYVEANKMTEASRQFERVLRINPRYPGARVEMGRVNMKLGEPKKALEDALAERAINPEMPDSYLLAAEAYFGLRQFSNCAREYQQAVTKRQQGATVFVRMARCYRMSGALESAESLLRQAQSMESGNPDIYKEQGAIFHMKGMADEAVTAYDTYLRLAPNASDRAEVENRIRRVRAGDLSTGS